MRIVSASAASTLPCCRLSKALSYRASTIGEGVAALWIVTMIPTAVAVR